MDATIEPPFSGCQSCELTRVRLPSKRGIPATLTCSGYRQLMLDGEDEEAQARALVALFKLLDLPVTWTGTGFPTCPIAVELCITLQLRYLQEGLVDVHVHSDDELTLRNFPGMSLRPSTPESIKQRGSSSIGRSPSASPPMPVRARAYAKGSSENAPTPKNTPYSGPFLAVMGEALPHVRPTPYLPLSYSSSVAPSHVPDNFWSLDEHAERVPRFVKADSNASSGSN